MGHPSLTMMGVPGPEAVSRGTWSPQCGVPRSSQRTVFEAALTTFNLDETVVFHRTAWVAPGTRGTCAVVLPLYQRACEAADDSQWPLTSRSLEVFPG